MISLSWDVESYKLITKVHFRNEVYDDWETVSNNVQEMLRVIITKDDEDVLLENVKGQSFPPSYWWGAVITFVFGGARVRLRRRFELGDHLGEGGKTSYDYV